MDCPFCGICAGTEPATILREWPDAIAIVPLNPVVDGHLLVIPRTHVADFAAAPEVSAAAMRRAAELAAETGRPMNLITSRGREATQTVWHLHLHLVPRRDGDTVALPWDPRGTGPDEAARLRCGDSTPNVYGLPIDELPEGWEPVEAIVVVKCLRPVGDDFPYGLQTHSTADLSTWEAEGMLRWACRAAAEFYDDDEDDEG